MAYKYKNIMIIDDEEIDNYLVGMLIRNNKIAETVLDFENGEEAFEYINEYKNDSAKLPDLILLDIHMPRMNGVEFIKNLEGLNIGFEGKCNVCLVTGSLNHDDIVKIKESKMVVSYTTKPITSQFFESL